VPQVCISVHFLYNCKYVDQYTIPVRAHIILFHTLPEWSEAGLVLEIIILTVILHIVWFITPVIRRKRVKVTRGVSAMVCCIGILVGFTTSRLIVWVIVTTMSKSGSYPVTPVALQPYSPTLVVLCYSSHGRADIPPLTTTLGLVSIQSLPHLPVYPVLTWVLHVLDISPTLYHFHQT